MGRPSAGLKAGADLLALLPGAVDQCCQPIQFLISYLLVGDVAAGDLGGMKATVFLERTETSIPHRFLSGTVNY